MQKKPGCTPWGGPLPSLERLCYSEPSALRLVAVSALVSVVYSAHTLKGGTMLVTQQPVLRRFWYATVPVGQLQAGPRPFTLLNEKSCCFSMPRSGPLLPSHRPALQRLHGRWPPCVRLPRLGLQPYRPLRPYPTG